VLRDLVARAERVGVVCKRAGGDAAAARGVAVAAEAVGGVEEGGSGEGAGINGFVPVSGGVSKGLDEWGRWEGGLRLVALIVAFVTQGGLVGAHQETVEGEEGALEEKRQFWSRDARLLTLMEWG
jgi:hypothetical protein